jgi:dephospho-CoA kinase
VTFQRVALTGGIATGKSWVLTRFAFHGVPTIDADAIAHDVVRAGQSASTDIRQRFGDAVFRPDGELDRPGLGARVFDNPEERQALEAIVHPHVRAEIDRWFSEVDSQNEVLFAVADIPLLFETGRQEEFDIVVVTACPPSLQLERLTARDHISEVEARQRITAQLPTERKVAAADFVVHTDVSNADTDRQVDEVVRILSSKSRVEGRR